MVLGGDWRPGVGRGGGSYRRNPLSRAEPILRARLLQSLSARFHSRVELGAFEVSLLRGFEVSGKDLAIHPYNLHSSTPTFSVRCFAFRTGYASLLRSPMHISHVEVDGLRINLPPKSQRKELPGSNNEHHASSKVSIFVGEMDCTDTVLTLGTDKPGKVPLGLSSRAFPCARSAPANPWTLPPCSPIPKPVGQIESRGSFGPWNTDRPGATALGGTYSFHDADLRHHQGHRRDPLLPGATRARWTRSWWMARPTPRTSR